MKKISILLLVFVAALASCKKTPEVNLKYVDVERDLVTVGTTTANIQCDYEYITTLKKAYLYYGEGEDETNMTSAEMQVVQKTLYVELTDLKENTTYSYYYEFVNGFNSMQSATKTFKTESSPISLATVITAEVIEITANSAKSGGEVTNDGGTEVTERGICWSTTANPTISDSHVAAGTGTGAFTATMSGLEANTTYHVRAYAINEKGTAYGLDKEFTTPVFVPEGAISGLFTINENGDKVYFSKGNLQYQASTNTWRFAEHQWSFVGGINTDSGLEFGNVYENGVKCDNELISQTYNGWIDLFGWGTSGYNHGAVCYQPWSISTDYSDYFVYGNFNYNLNDQNGQADWGFNAIYNGGNTTHTWHTLTKNEWMYVLNLRNTNSGARYAKAIVSETNGVVLLPDNWSITYFDLNEINNGEATYSCNQISQQEWTTNLEVNGAVFLPAAGYRDEADIHINGNGNYWTATGSSYDNAIMLWFYDNNLHAGEYHYYRYGGNSVRLVQDAE